MKPKHLIRALGALAAAVLLPQGAAFADTPKDLIMKGDAQCTTCHDEASNPDLLRVGKTRHGTVADKNAPTCTNCHGESKSHASYTGKDKPPKTEIGYTKKSPTTVAQRNETCQSCHKGGKHMNWDSSTHAARDVACTNCHTVHNGHDAVRDKVAQTDVCYACHKEQRAQMNRVSHHPVPEGKLGCSSCHNVHGDNPKQLIKASTNETCYSCHMEKRGPFIHNHEPVSEDCAICHQAHGTNTANLLKSRPPMLCVQCHGADSHPSQVPALPVGQAQLNTATSPVANNNARIMGTAGRGCLNCHTNIHGGNSTQTNATAERFRR